jgi:hypothetical protein
MSQSTPAIAVLKPDVKTGWRAGASLGRVPFDKVTWPLGRPDRCNQGTLADLTADDHIIGFPQNLSLRGHGREVRAKVSVVMAEPAAIHHAYHARVARHANQFHRILSYNEDLLARIPNGLFFPYGSTWVTDWANRDLTKTQMCSLIASTKRSQEGHALRHEIAKWTRTQGAEVALLGQGYAPFEDKADGLAHYRYSVVIENVRERNCFTEKLLDAVLCQTVPIYWGCPNIADFMDTPGMILCDTPEDIRSAIRAMSDDDYNARLPHLRAIEPVAAAYGDLFERAARAVAEDRPIP